MRDVMDDFEASGPILFTTPYAVVCQFEVLERQFRVFCTKFET